MLTVVIKQKHYSDYPESQPDKNVAAKLLERGGENGLLTEERTDACCF